MALVQQRREINLKEIFCYPLGPALWSLASVTAGMVKTNKSILMHELERGITLVDAIPKPFASVIDGMALVPQSNYIGLTYNEFTDNILNKFVTSTTSGASRIDIVFDIYRPDSIKNAERGQRSVGSIQLKTIVGAAPIKQWGVALSDGSNKSELIKFLVCHWVKHPSSIGNLHLFVAYEEKCVCITADCVCPVPALESNQEEADARMLLHAKHISRSVPNIVIHTPDTDVFLIAIAASTELPTNLFIRTGNKGKARITFIEKVKQSLSLQYDVNDMELAAKSILSFHAFTECDTTSAFCGKGKVKPLNILLKSSYYINIFSNIGVDASLGDDALNVLQQFVCDLYGHKGDNTNTLSYRF